LQQSDFFPPASHPKLKLKTKPTQLGYGRSTSKVRIKAKPTQLGYGPPPLSKIKQNHSTGYGHAFHTTSTAGFQVNEERGKMRHLCFFMAEE